MTTAPPFAAPQASPASPAEAFAQWLSEQGESASAEAARRYGRASALGRESELPGPVGERNLYRLHPRGRILLLPHSTQGLYQQMAAVLATGNHGVIEGLPLPAGLPPLVAAAFAPGGARGFSAALVEGGPAHVAAALARVASLPGAIIPVHAARGDAALAYDCNWLLEEVSLSINTTAAGGNASLMTIS